MTRVLIQACYLPQERGLGFELADQPFSQEMLTMP